MARLTIGPQFSPGKRVHFLTSPLGLKVLVDHTTVPTRTIADVTTCPFNQLQQTLPQLGVPALCFGDFDFAPGSTHVISGVSPQIDVTGKWWVFDSFSNGMGANAIYKTDSNTANPDTLTARLRSGRASLVGYQSHRVAAEC